MEIAAESSRRCVAPCVLSFVCDVCFLCSGGKVPVQLRQYAFRLADRTVVVIKRLNARIMENRVDTRMYIPLHRAANKTNDNEPPGRTPRARRYQEAPDFAKLLAILYGM